MPNTQELEYKKGTPVLARHRDKEGVLTGGSRHCGLEGCGGLQLGVRWPDGKLTWPCTKGMEWDGTQWRIL